MRRKDAGDDGARTARRTARRAAYHVAVVPNIAARGMYFLGSRPMRAAVGHTKDPRWWVGWWRLLAIGIHHRRILASSWLVGLEPTASGHKDAIAAALGRLRRTIGVEVVEMCETSVDVMRRGETRVPRLVPSETVAQEWSARWVA